VAVASFADPTRRPMTSREGVGVEPPPVNEVRV